MKQPMFVEVRGKSSSYIFHFKGNPAHLAAWRGDGLTVFAIEYGVPAWVAASGLARQWAALQKFWRLLRLW